MRYIKNVFKKADMFFFRGLLQSAFLCILCKRKITGQKPAFLRNFVQDDVKIVKFV